jgi:hypothetical protein
LFAILCGNPMSVMQDVFNVFSRNCECVSHCFDFLYTFVGSVSACNGVTKSECFSYCFGASSRGDISHIRNSAPVHIAFIHPIIVNPLIKSSCPAILAIQTSFLGMKATRPIHVLLGPSSDYKKAMADHKESAMKRIIYL